MRFLAIWFGAALASCQAVPRYLLATQTPHKDSVVLQVFLDEKQDVDVYRAIASRELTRILQESRASSVPLYEARFEFLERSDTPTRYAVAVWRRGPDEPDDDTGSVRSRPEWQIFLY